MKPRLASQIAAIASGRLVGDDAMVGPGVALDSHLVTPGCLFVAIPGARVDGHDFVAAAAGSGAAAALVSRQVEASCAQILVADTVDALSDLARSIHRAAQARGLTTFAVTGSSGKTSTKDLLAQCLEPVGPTVSPRGSYNSRFGLPATVASIDDKTRYLVAEMGASGVGHIAWLCTIAPPDIAAVLNVGHAHLGEFGSVNDIARAKGEIIEALPKLGWAVLNADDPLVAAMAPRTKAQVAWFSASGRDVPESDLWVGATDVRLDALDRASFRLVGHGPTGVFDEPVSLQTLGAHQVANACAVAAMALCGGLTPQQVVTGLDGATARSAWRMAPVELPGGRLIVNDAYNANPDSVKAALASIGRMLAARPGDTAVAVLGDMLELGETAPPYHEAVGAQAAGLGIDVLAVGAYAGALVNGARRAGGKADVVERADVADWLSGKAYNIVLLKASRGVGLEGVVEELKDRWAR
ncbi:MAG: UDP-N-acetylmuramoyl-tripeptide--D-alanyl-D-alanine ligase [Propionibacteriaceae bacterium]|nr:UDP-N-acetylmuramoyl-tripeptide--D-alanyl-D-alanine ligase [Propionibacteriaceae bacterium]